MESKPMLVVEIKIDKRKGNPPQDIGANNKPIAKKEDTIKPKKDTDLFKKRHFIVE